VAPQIQLMDLGKRC